MGVVCSPALTVHADLDLQATQRLYPMYTGELTALIGVDQADRNQNSILRIQLGIIYNEYRAKLVAGDYRTWICRQWQSTLENATSQKSAFDREYLRVCISKNEKAEKDLEKYNDKLIPLVDFGHQVEHREKVLNISEMWSAVNFGGVEGGIHRCDISMIPRNVTFNIK